MSDYPSECLRGISLANDCSAKGVIESSLFNRFDKTERSDGFSEMSITWNDNDEAVRIITFQKKAGEIQFKIGLAVLLRSQIDLARRNPYYCKILKYERKPSVDNPYHGNILIDSNANKSDKRRVASFLAVGAKFIPRDKNWDKTPMSSVDIKAVFLSDNTKNE